MPLSDADILCELELVRERGGFTSLMFPTDKAAIAFARAVLDKAQPVRSGPVSLPLTLTPAGYSVLVERKRQVEVEGFTFAQDDAYQYHELRKAAAAYLMHNGDPYLGPQSWPWDFSQWKPGSARANLVKAGALVIAEIERIDRATLRGVAVEPSEETRHD